MESIKNNAFSLQLSDQGFVEKLLINEDSENMNWVIDPPYLREVGYQDADKLFGHFRLTVNDVEYSSTICEQPKRFRIGTKKIKLVYSFDRFEVHLTYDLESDEESLNWNVCLHNISGSELVVHDFLVWSALAYIMYRDADVHRNISQSCAVFPSISQDFSKIAAVRRSHNGPHLGMYAVKGETRSVGTYCRFENNFFKNVSPSLDGILYHNLVLVGTGSNERSTTASDWIYMSDVQPLRLAAGCSVDWEYVLMPYDEEQQFYENAFKLGHPIIEYNTVTVIGGMFQTAFRLPEKVQLVEVWIESFENSEIQRIDLTERVKQTEDGLALEIRMNRPGERKLGIVMNNGKTDSVVFNVIEPIKEIIEARADYICRSLYQNEDAETPHAFLPISNQGESLGKLILVLKKNLLGTFDLDELRKVENSAVHYIKPKWFENGDFFHPAKLYDDFYRIFDLDYVAHVFYLLSKFQANQLVRQRPADYLKWAAEVMIVRLDENFHEDEREKKETHMLGVYTLFIKDLLQNLAQFNMTDMHEQLSRLFTATVERIRLDSGQYKGAVTEHFYDNAGFGPTCEALCLLDHTKEAKLYGELLLANIGYSNDFRAQNPDRWWEALSYMTHSLWGGLVAASTLVAYEHLRDNDYLKAAYRATMPVFYCYDWHATATNKKLERGQAASTYSVASPNMNRPDLSRNRFGQSVFAQDGGLFEKLFSNASGDDWDMGEEVVAYLSGFGTKCFLYVRDGEVCCINGEITRHGDRYEVNSYAAYPREFHFFEENAAFQASPGEEVRTVIFENGQFVQPLLNSKGK
ncbi:hypothetical protein [Paenibacillus agricola]|uniref:Uncharacterized protein n=1 Tax=Paenibacillus agricola TaxID=2716264 RepID=A0ABX0JLQ9_9BACL|nr:hypothetical protein [Paenibacillus agricola]NHN34980.1 hypothetical protein [Paenibacillus agricola]